MDVWAGRTELSHRERLVIVDSSKRGSASREAPVVTGLVRGPSRCALAGSGLAANLILELLFRHHRIEQLSVYITCDKVDPYFADGHEVVIFVTMYAVSKCLPKIQLSSES
jgi:hypothetical protein